MWIILIIAITNKDFLSIERVYNSKKDVIKDKIVEILIETGFGAAKKILTWGLPNKGKDTDNKTNSANVYEITIGKGPEKEIGVKRPNFRDFWLK